MAQPYIDPMLAISDSDREDMRTVLVAHGVQAADHQPVIHAFVAHLTMPDAPGAGAMLAAGITPFRDDQFIGTRRLAWMLRRELSGRGEQHRLSLMIQMFGTDALPLTEALFQHGPMTWPDEAPKRYDDLHLVPDNVRRVDLGALPVALIRGVQINGVRQDTAAVVEIEVLEKLRRDSEALNAIGYAIAKALGKVPDGADYLGDPSTDVTGLIQLWLSAELSLEMAIGLIQSMLDLWLAERSPRSELVHAPASRAMLGEWGRTFDAIKERGSLNIADQLPDAGVEKLKREFQALLPTVWAARDLVERFGSGALGERSMLRPLADAVDALDGMTIPAPPDTTATAG